MWLLDKMLNDKCIKSCSVLIAQCNNSIITTEGLGKKDKLHKVQKVFKKSSCRFTMWFLYSRYIFSALELSNDDQIKSDKQIREFLDGNPCRCTDIII